MGEEVWTNYISNAIKYGGRPPHIELEAETLPEGMTRFWVKDNGEGISPKDQAILFTPFTRRGLSKVEGHGLGLSIVQRIVEKLGGVVGWKASQEAAAPFSSSYRLAFRTSRNSDTTSRS